MSARRPRVVVDLLYFTGRRGGTETYAQQVLPRLAALGPDLELVALANTSGRRAISSWFPGAVRTLPIDGHNRPVWAAAETLAVAPVLSGLHADLVWCPANFGPGWGRVPRVVTVHDVISFDFPSPDAQRVTQWVTTAIIARAARGANRLITDSEASADAIVRVLGVGRERITATPLASRAPTPVDDPAGERSGLGLDTGRPYVLSTGNRLPHKNFDGLLRALAAIPADRRPLLVLTGSHGPDPLRALVAELGLAADVLLLGWVTVAQLEALFLGAAAYVCPSLAEGFGLPVLDAMTRGCPVLAADLPVLREVGGAAARYADATRPEQLAAAITALVEDPDARARLRIEGMARAAEFSWDRTAEQTVAVFRDALAG